MAEAQQSAGMFNPRGFYLKREGEYQKNSVINFFKSPSLIGRHETAVQTTLLSKVISRTHCKVDFVNGKMYIEDLKSSNGTWINDTKLVQRTEVDEGDLIGIGMNPTKSPKPDEAETSFTYRACIATQITLYSDEESQSNMSINELCNDLDDNVGIINALSEVPIIIELSDEEESEMDKEWARKLSQSKRPSPPPSQMMSSSTNFDDPDSDAETSMPTMRDCSVEIMKLPKNVIERALNKACMDDSSSSESENDNNKHQKTRKAEKHKSSTHDEEKAKSRRTRELKASKKESKSKIVKQKKERLKDPWKDLIDSDSDSESEPEEPPIKRSRGRPPKNKQVPVNVVNEPFNSNKNAKNKNQVPESSRDAELECVATPNSAKIIIRRKSICDVQDEKHINETNSTKNLQSLLKPSTSKAFDPFDFPDDSNSSTSKDLKAQKKPMPSRRMTFCAGDKEKVAPVVYVKRKITPIIDARPIPKRRASKYDPAPLTSGTKAKPIPARRSSMHDSKMSNEVDMFSIGVGLRNATKPPIARRQSTDASREDDKKMKEARNEKLREIAMEIAEKKKRIEEAKKAQAEITKDRTASKPKVKLTDKNRGDFLTNLPEASAVIKPVKKATTAIAKPESHAEAPDATEIVKNIASFAKMHMKQVVKGADMKDGIGSNVEFENLEEDIERRRLNEPLDNIRFYQPLPYTDVNISPNPWPNLRPILKKIGARPRFANRRISWAKEEHLERKWIFERDVEDDTVVPQNTSAHPGLAPIQTTTMPTTTLPTLPTETVVGNEQSMNRQVVEEKVINQILKWDSKWLKLTNAQKPNTFHISPMKNIYENLSEYQKILEPIIELDLLSRMTNSYSKTYANVRPADKWESLLFEYSECGLHGKTRLHMIASESAQQYKIGMFILLKTHNKVTNQDTEFFGYVSSSVNTDVNYQQNRKIIVEAMLDGTNLAGIAVLKSRRITYIRAELKALISLKSLKSTQFVSKMLNPKLNTPCKFGVPEGELEFRGLTLSADQTKIVRQVTGSVMADTGIIAIEGGPGTGKTKVIVASILHITSKIRAANESANPSILVVSMSNSCIDEICTILQPLARDMEINLLRTGVADKIKKEILPVSLNELCKKQCSMNRNLNYKTIQKGIIMRANVILTTINSSFDLHEHGKKFDICFIDEASQCTEAETIIPFQLDFKNMVLVGDKNQLQPKVMSQSLMNSGFDESLFSRICNVFISQTAKPVLTLTQQYRMHPEIFEFPNTEFYKSCISTPINLVYRHPKLTLKPYFIFNIESYQALTQDTSAYNNSEATFVTNLANLLSRSLPEEISIGIITAYIRQSKEIEEKLIKKDRVQVYTIDSAQGLERDVIIFSVTRSNDLGFLKNAQRLNVALTRAKRAMFICGNFSSLQVNELWSKLTVNARKRGLYRDVGVHTEDDDLIELLNLSH